jgi:hypothetical protein
VNEDLNAHASRGNRKLMNAYPAFPPRFIFGKR